MGRAVVSTPIALGMAFTLAWAWGMSHGWNATFGRFLQWLNNLGLSFGTRLGHISIHPFGFAGTIDRNMRQFFSATEAMAEKRLVQALNAIVEPFLLMAGVTLALGLVGYEGLQALWHHVTHTAPRIAADTGWKPLVRKLNATTAKLSARIDSLAHRLDALRTRVQHATATATHAIATTIPRVGHLERTGINVRSLPKWLKKHLTAILVGGVLLTALRRVGLGWTRCTNVGKVNKRICGVDPSWVDEFLAATLLIASTNSLHDFVKDAQGGVKLGMEGMQLFIREAKDFDLSKL